MKRILLILLALVLVGCTAAPSADPTGEPVIETPEATAPETAPEAETEEPEAEETASQLSDLERHGIEDLGDSLRFEDALGNMVTIKKNPARVISAYNSYVDLWYKLGGSLVGKIKESADKPIPAAKDVEVIGDNSALSEETIVALEPDLILLSTHSVQMKARENLEQAGIPVLTLEAKDLADYVRLVRILSAIMDNEAGYQEYGLAVEQEVADIIAQVPTDRAPRVMLMVNTSTELKTQPSQNMTGFMLTDLGAVNVADKFASADSAEQEKVLSLEQILVEDPEIIFVRELGSKIDQVREVRQKELASSDVWSSLQAIQNDQMYILEKDLYTFMPNERYAEAYRNLAKILYPDIFK